MEYETCDDCGGTGNTALPYERPQRCSTCDGKGWVER